MRNSEQSPRETCGYLDLCTGAGSIAIFSAYKGARKVVAVDINPTAVRAAEENARLHGFSDIIEVRLSDVFENIERDKVFDVVTGNFPLTMNNSEDYIEKTMYDQEFHVHKEFFVHVKDHLTRKGRIYLTQANFSSVDKMKALARNSGFIVRRIGTRKMPENDPREFYAFELLTKDHNQ